MQLLLLAMKQSAGHHGTCLSIRTTLFYVNARSINSILIWASGAATITNNISTFPTPQRSVVVTVDGSIYADAKR